jgi:mandelate racemase/muconate lactonizing enzyme-like protein
MSLDHAELVWLGAFHDPCESKTMKIDDITVTLFAWDDIPPTQYGRQTGRFSGRSDLGLVTIKTDQGLEGHAFLGGSNRAASVDAEVIIQVFKPMLLGADPLDRELHFQRMWQRGRLFAIRTIGAIDVALWDLAGKGRQHAAAPADGQLPQEPPGLRIVCGAAVARSLCRGSHVVP